MKQEITDLELDINQLPDNQLKIESLLELARKCQDSSYLSKGEFYARKALELALSLDDQASVPLAKIRLGFINYRAGEYDTAISFFQEAAQNSSDDANTATAYDGMGIVYGKMMILDKALDYQLKALQMRKEMDNHRAIQQSLNNISNIYRKAKDYDKALENLFKSLEIARKLDRKRSEAMVYNNIGECYREMGDLDNALDYYQRALEIKQKVGDRRALAISLINMGLINREQENYKEALDYYHQALDLVGQMENNHLKMSVSEKLADVYEELEDYQQALSYHKIYTEVKDTIFNEKSSRRIAEMEAKFEVAVQKREAEIYRLKNVELADAKDKIEQQKIELENVNKELNELNQSKDSILRIVSHDLKGTIGSIIPLCDMISFKRKLDTEVIQTLNMIKDNINRSLLLVDDILEANRIDMEGFSLDLQEINIVDVFFEYYKSFSQMALKKDIKLNYNPGFENLVCKIDLNRFWQVVHNLMSNAVKFTPRNGKIDIELKKMESPEKPDYVLISIKDTGIGIPENQLEEIFKKFTSARRVGTEGETTTGLGLSIVKKLVNLHQGEISVESEVGVGSVFKLKLPLVN
ncbi:MAG: hypothetical protein APR63_12145 [Desulfuromonas sp. SDB]|nr:MAG: hypothetical protein APR63_12145 [Desulfuromonas sp. SDB]